MNPQTIYIPFLRNEKKKNVLQQSCGLIKMVNIMVDKRKSFYLHCHKISHQVIKLRKGYNPTSSVFFKKKSFTSDKNDRYHIGSHYLMPMQMNYCRAPPL